jgi:Tol biopolymer transport system component
MRALSTFGGRALLRSAVLLILGSAALAWPDQARASFPGENGRLVFTWHLNRVVGTDLLATTLRGINRRVLNHCQYGCSNNSGDWSPDGRRLVYVQECTDSFCNNLVKIPPDGRPRKVIYEAGIDFLLSSPVWSPDGSKIAFARYRWSQRVGDWVSDIYLISRNGTGLTRLTNTPRVSEDELDWSSQNLLVFRASRGRWRENRYELYTMRPNGQDRRRLTNNRLPDTQPDWAPGGRRLTFVRKGDVWKMSASGQNASSAGAASGHSPTWAPDGSVIAFVSADDLAIHTVRPTGADDTLLGDPVNQGSVWQLDWQPR